MTLSGSNPRRRQRWTLLGAAVLVMTLFGAMIAVAQLDRTLFELDKDATNNTTSPKMGVLNANVGTTTLPATTSIQICQDVSAFYNGATILVDAERMTLASGANAAGGGCPSDFSFKRNYTATRGVAGTVTAHSKGEDVTRLVIVADTAQPGDSDDWDDVYDLVFADLNDEGDDDKCIALGAAECVFIRDGRAISVFTQSKDYDEISDDAGATSFWKWRDQSVPDANELDDGFAIKYVKDDGTQHVFFGADRFATEGTKDAGFWFFQAEVGTEEAASGDSTFTGLHTAPDPGTNGLFCVEADGGNVPGGQSSPVPACQYDSDDTGGDVLILTSFSGGGATVTVRVFEWVGPAGSVAALLERAVQGDCVPGAVTQELCATVNNTTVESKWNYLGKNEPAAFQIASGGLLEGGVNLTALGLEGCFSSFMATTRSSDSLTADPKDFILGDFEACDTELTTTPANGLSIPTALADSDSNGIPDIEIGTGAAGVDVTDKALVDVKGTATWSGTLDFYLCGPINPPVDDDPLTPEDEEFEGDLCDTGGVKIGATQNVSSADATAPNYVSDTANLTPVGYYCWRGEFTSETDGVPDADDATRGECFEVLPVTPTLSTTAWSTGDSSGSALSGPVDFGNPVYDKATLGGTAYQPGDTGHADYPTINATMDTPANGTITFTLVGPDGSEVDCTTLATSDDASEDNPEDVTVSGDADYFTSGFTPDAPGDYHWKASYDGDSPNTLGTSHNDACDESAEDVTVRQIPTTVKTKQSWFPNDTATIASTVTGDSLADGGTVDFYLYNNASCTAGTDDVNILYTERITLGNDLGNSTEVGTSNYPGANKTAVPGFTWAALAITTGYDDAAGSTSPTTGSYSWKVVYTPPDSAHTGKQSACAETFFVTYTNDAGPGTDLP